MRKSTVICREDVGLVPPTRRAVSWLPARALGLAVLAITPLPVLAQVGPATSFEQGTTHMDELELANPELLQKLFPAPARPEEEASPFFRDTKISAQARTYYFNGDKFNPTRSEAWAIGGSAAYKSGYAADRFAIGAVAYTSQKLYGPEQHDGTLLLKPGQESYSVLGEIYGEFKISDRIFGAFGRKEYDTPYINGNDTRMTPNTF